MLQKATTLLLFTFCNLYVFAQGTIVGPDTICSIKQNVTYCYSGPCNCPGSTWQEAAPATGNVIFTPNANPLCVDLMGAVAGTYTVEYVIGGACNCTPGTVISKQITILYPNDASFTTYDFCENYTNTVNPYVSTGTFSFNPMPSDGATMDPNTGIISNGVGGNSYTIMHVVGSNPCADTVMDTVFCIPASDPRCAAHPCDLIRNGNFETYNSCPTGFSQIQRADNWYSSTASNDYYNTCGWTNVGGVNSFGPPPLPYPSGVGCAGSYSNHVNASGYYRENFGQHVELCAGQKYRFDIMMARSDSIAGSNVLNNISLFTGNSRVIPVPINATTYCPIGFTELFTFQGNTITPAWAAFTNTFTSPSNTNTILFGAACSGPYNAIGYVFYDDMKLVPIDTLTVNNTNISTCDTASFTVTIPGGCYGPYSIVLDNGTTSDTITNVTSSYTHSIYPAQTGTYTITSMANKFGCSTLLNIPINVTAGASVNINQSGSICNGQSYTLPGGGVVTNPGTYIDTITGGSCDTIYTTLVSIANSSTSSQNPTICTGQSYTLPGGTVVITAGTYMDTLTNVNGCDSIITTNLTVSNALTGTQSPTLCQGTSFTLPGGTIVTTAGSYTDTVTATGGCDSIITTTLSYNPTSTNSQSPVICANESYTLPGGTIVTTSGTYSDTLTNQYGCDSIITTTLTVNPQPTTTISPNITIQPGDNTTLTATGGTTYTWTPSTGLDNTNSATVIATPTQTTTYCVKITDNNGCTDSICVTVTVELPCPSNENLQVPNAFSPNNDNVNDEFCLQGWDACVEDFQILIYNRWGEKVYESKDVNFCWQGRNRGIELDAQVFVYYLSAKYSNLSEPITKSGNISLLK